jgi:hypothetical protein
MVLLDFTFLDVELSTYREVRLSVLCFDFRELILADYLELSLDLDPLTALELLLCTVFYWPPDF